MTTEQQWLGNTPYTHPSMPGTPPMFDLSAALEDAEGRKLAQDIIDRKALRNLRDRFIQELIYGDVLTDGHGNVIPRQEPEHWASLRAATVTGQMTHETGWRSRILVGGRGYGKNSARAEWLRGREVVTDFLAGIRGEERPWLSSITWSCPKPTDIPLSMIRDSFPTNSYGWMIAEAALRFIPPNTEHNRKLNAQIAAKVHAIHDILGVTPHGSNDSQVP